MMARYTLMECVILVVLVLFIALIGVSLFVPHTNKAREPEGRVSCASNLKQIGLGLLMYAGDHDGYFPLIHENREASFAPLAQHDYIQNGKVWACPSRAEMLTLATNSAYLYIGSGQKDDNDDAGEISLAYDEFMNHPGNGWMNVLFIDGHVEGAKPGTKPWAENGP